MGCSHLGSSIDDFLKEEGILDEAQAVAVKEVVEWQTGKVQEPAMDSGDDVAAGID